MTKIKQSNIFTKKIIITILLLIVVKFILAFVSADAIDMPGYKAWSISLAQNPLANIYDNFHVVYGPVYLYLLLISGKISLWLNFSDKLHEILIKTWSIFSDIICAYLIYLLGKKYNKNNIGLWLGIFYALNPAIILNSTIWGQFDSFASMLMFLTIYLLISQRKIAGSIIFTIALLTKPQCAFILPIFIFLYLNNINWRIFIISAISSFITFIILIWPFTSDKNIFWLLPHYLQSSGDYPYATANAFNLWTLLGGQTIADQTNFYGLSYTTWGVLAIIIVFAISISYFYYYKKFPIGVYFATFYICLGVFMLGTRMHERYLFPAIIFGTVCLFWEKKFWIPVIMLSICHFANVYYIYWRAWHNIVWVPNYDLKANIVAFITFAVFIYFTIYIVQKIFQKYQYEKHLQKIQNR